MIGTAYASGLNLEISSLFQRRRESPGRTNVTSGISIAQTVEPEKDWVACAGWLTDASKESFLSISY
jgi:hypothetical protein